MVVHVDPPSRLWFKKPTVCPLFEAILAAKSSLPLVGLTATWQLYPKFAFPPTSCQCAPASVLRNTVKTGSPVPARLGGRLGSGADCLAGVAHALSIEGGL